MKRLFSFIVLFVPYALLAGAGAAFWERESYFSEAIVSWLPLWLCIAVLLTGYLLYTLRYLAVFAAFGSALLLAAWFVEVHGSPVFAEALPRLSIRHATIAQWNPRHDIGVVDWLRRLDKEIDLVVLSDVGPAISAQLTGPGALFPFKLSDAEARIVILSRQPLWNPTPVTLPGASSPMLRAETNLAGQRVRLFALNTTEPNDRALWQQRDRELSHAAHAIKDSPYPVLLVGNLNVSPYSAAFLTFVTEAGLGTQTPAHAMPTSWPSYALIPPLQIATDYVLVSERIRIETRKRNMPCCSSHVALYTKIGF